MKYDRRKDNNPPISNDLREEILKKGFVTGSKVFGGFSPISSDIDICLPPIKGMGFHDLETYGWYWKGYEEFTEFRNAYFKTNMGEVFNILFFIHQEDWLEWRVTTGAMIRVIKASKKIEEAVARSKAARVHMFESIRMVLYGHTMK